MCGVASSINTAKYTPPGFIRTKKSKTPWEPQTAGQSKKIHPEKNCFIALNSGFHPIQSEKTSPVQSCYKIFPMITDKWCYKIHYPFYFRSVMGQVNYNLSFSVWVVKVQWSVAIDTTLLIMLLLRWMRWNLNSYKILRWSTPHHTLLCKFFIWKN